jgi:transcriptional regulator with XRE-family HTH domain
VSIDSLALKGQLREFGEALRLLRTSAGLTQIQLAELMSERGHSWYGSTVSKSESGERDPSLQEIYALAGVFQVATLALMRADASRAWLRRERELLIEDLKEDIAEAEDELTARLLESEALTETIQQVREKLERLKQVLARNQAYLEQEDAALTVSTRDQGGTGAEDR